MTDPSDLPSLLATKAFHERELARVNQALAERQKNHDDPLYHDLTVQRRERLRVLRRALLWLLLFIAPVARDVLRALARAVGIDL